MKSRIICLLTVISLLFAATSPTWAKAPSKKKNPVVEGNNQFATDLYAELGKEEGGNLLMSPYSISTALAMTYAGARGETEAEMAEVLHFTLPQERLHPAFAGLISHFNEGDKKRPYQLNVANRLWGQKGYRFLPDFVKTTEDNYGAELAQVDFVRNAEGARQTINRWVEEQTQEKIKDLIPSGVLDSMTRLVLTNAIYFKGDWKYQFDKKRTKDAPFMVTPEKKIKVPMMQQQTVFKYAAYPELQVLEMPYSGDELSMVVLLPKKVDGLADLEKPLTEESIEKWTSRLRPAKVSVFLPRFKMTCQFGLNGVLASMGMPEAFSKSADFSGMNGKKDLYISAVIHKAFIDVNEEGTEAAAATAVVIRLKSARPRPNPVFRADHPFIFLLKDNQTGSILFMGRVVEPKGDE